MTMHSQRLWRIGAPLALTAAAVVGALAPALTRAAGFPEKPIRIVVGFAPGGSTDSITRELARKLEAELGQPVVVENKPGGGQVLAMQTVANASADGYMLVIGSPGGFSVSPNLYKRLQYDSRKFVPIAPIAAQANVLVAHPDFPASSISEMVKLAQSRKGGLNYGSFGAGTSAHLAMEMLKRQAGMEATHIAYKGDPPAIMAVRSKEVEVAVITMFSAMPRIRSGELKGLGVYQSRADRNLPQLQTTSQAGYADIDLPSWLGLFAPPGTPKAVTDKLEAATRKVVGSTDFQNFVVARGNDPITLANKKFLAMIEKQSADLGAVIRTLKLQPE